MSLKLETNPFDYFEFGCCGEGLTDDSYLQRKKESDVNYGLSYKHSKFGNIDFSYVKGNTWNINFSVGFSGKKSLRKKNKFEPKIENKNFNKK